MNTIHIFIITTCIGIFANYSIAKSEHLLIETTDLQRLAQTGNLDIPEQSLKDSPQPERETIVRNRLEERFQSFQNQEEEIRDVKQELDRRENMQQERRRGMMMPLQRDQRPRNPQNNANRPQRDYVQELAERVEHRMEAMDVLQQRIIGVEKQMHDYFNELSNKIDRSFEQSQQKNHNEQQMMEQQREEMRRHEQEMQQQHEQINRLRHELEERTRQTEMREQEIQRHEQEQGIQLQQQRQEIERERGNLNRQLEDLKRREEELQRRFQEVENRFRELEERERMIQQQHHEIENAQNNIQREREQLEREREEQRHNQDMREREDHDERNFGPFGVILLILLIILWLWAIQDCLRRGKDDFPSGEPNDKLIWTVVLLLTLFIGAIFYVFLVQGYRKKANKA